MGISRIRIAARVLMLVAAGCSLAGCIGTTAGQLMPANTLSAGGLYFVERQPNDGRDLATNIADALRARGLEAMSGRADERPARFDYLVTYTDRWMWDMRMYLTDLRIEVRDAENMALLGYGQSAQSSLKAMGKTHDDVIGLALTELLGRR